MGLDEIASMVSRNFVGRGSDYLLVPGILPTEVSTYVPGILSCELNHFGSYCRAD